MQTLSEKHLHCFITQNFAFGFLLYSFRAVFFTVNSQRGELGVWSHHYPTSKLFQWTPMVHFLRSTAALFLGFKSVDNGDLKISFLLISVFIIIFKDISSLVMCVQGLKGPGRV